MTKSDLFDWLMQHNCEVVILPEGRARVIKIRNKSTNSSAFINTPIDDSRIEPYTVCKICSLLGAPIPDCANHMKEVTKFLKDRHYPDR